MAPKGLVQSSQRCHLTYSPGALNSTVELSAKLLYCDCKLYSHVMLFIIFVRDGTNDPNVVLSPGREARLVSAGLPSPTGGSEGSVTAATTGRCERI